MLKNVTKILKDPGSDEDTKIRALKIMSCASTIDQVENVLSLAFSEHVSNDKVTSPPSPQQLSNTPTKTPPQLLFLLWDISSSVPGATGVWAWAQAHWPQLSSTGRLPVLLPRIIGGFSTRDQLESVEDFFCEKDTSGYEAELKQGLKGIYARWRQAERDGEEVREWLERWEEEQGDPPVRIEWVEDRRGLLERGCCRFSWRLF